MTHDIILKNEASLIKMGRDLEEIGYTLVEASSTTRLYNALPSAEDPEYDYQFVELTVHVAYYRGKRSGGKEDGPGYEDQYGFETLYPKKTNQKEVLKLIKQGHGMGVTTGSDQNVFARWSKWNNHLAHFKATVLWLAERTGSETEDSEEESEQE